MEPDDARALYGTHYAEVYDGLWQENPLWAPEAEHYLESFRQVLDPGDRWLDVGCGTGWFLSRFPGVRRAGVDLSPAMIERAKAANPDAEFFHEGDIRDDVDAWHGAFDLVSSTGQAWCYVDRLSDIEQVAGNMARWTSPQGRVLLQGPGIRDLTGLPVAEHFDQVAPPRDPVSLTAVTWSFRDDAGLHENMIWPSFDTWVRWFSTWFRHIEIITWPWDPPPPVLTMPRRLLVASGKRTDGDDSPVVISERPLFPDQQVDPVAAVGPTLAVGPIGASGTEVLAPPEGAATAAGGPGRSAGGVSDGPGHDRPSPAGSEDRQHQPGRKIPGQRLVDQPLSYLLGRIQPTRRSFWRSVAKRLRRLGRSSA